MPNLYMVIWWEVPVRSITSPFMELYTITLEDRIYFSRFKQVGNLSQYARSHDASVKGKMILGDINLSKHATKYELVDLMNLALVNK